MRRKVWFVFFLLTALMAAAARSIYLTAGRAEYVMAAEGQSLYRLDVAQTRGMIYDRNLNPLVGETETWVAAVAPTIETIGALERATGGRYRERLALALEDGKPFLWELGEDVDRFALEGLPGINLFRVPERYAEDQPAAHVIGYVDGMGTGVSGVELAMNDVLEERTGKAAVYYQVDALGRVLAGVHQSAADTLELSRGGVALTLDREIQKLTEKAGDALEKGAVVVAEAPECEIRGLASFPGYSPVRLAEAASRDDGPLVNRAFCAYAPGSVFKLVTAAATLESGERPAVFTCTGSVTAGGLEFQCINGMAHGRVDLKRALEHSCNCYFITRARALGGQAVLNTAYNLGLGEEQEFGRGLFTQPGDLPTAAQLENPRALANFAFGQGDVTATPVQLCALVNAIVSNGVYASPKLIAGTVDSQLELTPARAVSERSVRVMKPGTAAALRECMEATIEEGTGRPGKPENAVAGVKTGTAQTGAFAGDQELLHFWYCGYVRCENGTTYCVTVLSESTPDDKGATARVFREVAEGLAKLSN